MPTNNTHPRYAGISDSRKSWAIRHFPSLRSTQPINISIIRQPPQYLDSPWNLRLQKFVGNQTFSVRTIYPTYQYQHLTKPPPPSISTVANGLWNLTLHPHPARNEWMTEGLVCGKSFDQVKEETVADYLNQTAEPDETVRDSQIKRNASIDGIESGVFTFLPRDYPWLPPVTAWSTPSVTTDKAQACRDTRCPYLKIRLTKLSLNSLLDKFPPHSFLLKMVYVMIYIIIHTYTIPRIFMYLGENSISIGNRLVSFTNG